MFKDVRIKERLTKAFVMVTSITAVAAVVGLIAMIVMSNRYAYALDYFGFAQGDIGKALVVFADTRSSLRAAIGYSDQDAIDTVSADHDEKKEWFEKYFVDIEGRLTTEESRAIYKAIQDDLEAYWKLDQEIMDLGATTDMDKAAQAQVRALHELTPAYNAIYEELAEILNIKVESGNELATMLNILSWSLCAVIVATIIIAMFVSIRLGNSIAKGIALPLGDLSERLRTFAGGDLSSPFPVIDSHDEVADMIKEATNMANNLNVIINDAGGVLGEMAGGNYAVESDVKESYTGDFMKLIDSMRMLRDQMTATLRSIEEASSQVSAGSGNLADASQSLAEGATDQAGAVEELQATITSSAESIAHAAENAEASSAQARHYADEADKSRVEMEAMVEAMARINETSKKIENIISEIEDIASQTNLLSLNASIEAARAGEAGRGFAVVADQIRQLADQSTQSAVDTRQLIEGSLLEISHGNSAAERAANSIEEVVEGIKKIAESSRELSTVSADMANAMKQAEAGVSQISEVVQSNSATAEESSATSQELSAQAVALDELIGQFVLK